VNTDFYPVNIFCDPVYKLSCKLEFFSRVWIFFTVLSLAVLGKQGFARLKTLLFDRIRRFAPPAKVFKVRYRIGLVMFFVPILFGCAYPYLNEIFSGFKD
jgi:hypothetical protein